MPKNRPKPHARVPECSSTPRLIIIILYSYSFLWNYIIVKIMLYIIFTYEVIDSYYPRAD